jgi:hypothetical protein
MGYFGLGSNHSYEFLLANHVKSSSSEEIA